MTTLLFAYDNVVELCVNACHTTFQPQGLLITSWNFVLTLVTQPFNLKEAILLWAIPPCFQVYWWPNEKIQGFQSWRFYAKVAVFRASWRPKIRGDSPPKKWRFLSIFKIVKKVAILVRFGPKSGDFWHFFWLLNLYFVWRISDESSNIVIMTSLLFQWRKKVAVLGQNRAILWKKIFGDPA